MAEIPDRLRANGRAVDQEFTAREKLFRRYKLEHYLNGQFSNVGLRLSVPPSVNREKYSQAEDVLLSEHDEFVEWGVWSLKVEDLPLEVTPEQPLYTVAPRHVPLPDNYSHSEMWCDRLPKTGAYVAPNNAAKKFIRALLSQRVHIEIPARV